MNSSIEYSRAPRVPHERFVAADSTFVAVIPCSSAGRFEASLVVAVDANFVAAVISGSLLGRFLARLERGLESLAPRGRPRCCDGTCMYACMYVSRSMYACMWMYVHRNYAARHLHRWRQEV